MPESPDYSEAGEVFRKSMEEALAHLDEVNANLRKEQDKAIQMQLAAKEEFNRIEREAHQISEAYMEKHRKAYMDDLRKEILLEFTKKLILAEIPSDKLRLYLEIPPKILADAWFAIGFEKLDEKHIGHVAYESQTRSGTIYFYRNDIILHFPFEFTGGDTLVSIEVPASENWEKMTGLPLADRQPILEFVAQRVVRDQAPKGASVIGPDRILIKH